MSESFDFNEWIRNNKTGPYSKDSFSRKGMLKESEGHIEEDDTIEEAPAPPSPENVYEPDSEQDYYDRAMDLAGMQIKSAIDALMQDGFDKEEIEELLPRLAMTLVMDYDTAFSGMDEGEEHLKEYEIACVERDGKYYKVNDEDQVVSGPYMDPDCMRRSQSSSAFRGAGGFPSRSYSGGGGGKAQSISPSSIGLSSMPSDLGLKISKLVSMTGQYGPFYVITFTGTGENPKVKWGRISITASERDAERMKSGGEEAIRSFINGKIDSGKYKKVF